MERPVSQIIDDIKYIAGADTLTNARAFSLINYGLDRYSNIAILSSGRWKFDASTHQDQDGNPTLPIATATLNAGEESIPLNTTFLTINQVQVYIDGKWQVLTPSDTRDNKQEVQGTTYAVNGKPMKYDYDAHNLFVYPRAETSTPIKILYSRATPHITQVTDTLGIPSIHEQYIVDFVCYRIGIRTVDGSKTDLRAEIQKWEGVDGVSGGIIRDWYSKRDQDTPRRLKGMTPSVFMITSRGKGRRGGRSGFIS